MKALVESVLQPARDKFKKPIIIASGYRCKELNRLIGGATNSQHMTGQAADIKASDPDENGELFKLIRKEIKDFDQLIWEFGDEDNPAWIHISFSKTRNRKQVLKAYKLHGKTHYSVI